MEIVKRARIDRWLRLFDRITGDGLFIAADGRNR